MFYNKNEKKLESLDRLELATPLKSYLFNSFYGKLYEKSYIYLFLSICIYFILSYYWSGFLIILIANIIRWKIITQKEYKEYQKEVILNKIEIIQEEIDSEIWWKRAELNTLDYFGYCITDFDFLIYYLDLLNYYDFFNNFLYKKTNIKIINNIKFNNIKSNKVNIIKNKEKIKKYINNNYIFFLRKDYFKQLNFNIKIINFLYKTKNNKFTIFN